MSDISPLETVCKQLEVIKYNGMGLKKAAQCLKTAYFLKEHTLSTQENSKYLSKLEMLFDEIYHLCANKMQYLIGHEIEKETAQDIMELAWIIGEKAGDSNEKVREINDLVNEFAINSYNPDVFDFQEAGNASFSNYNSLISEKI